MEANTNKLTFQEALNHRDTLSVTWELVPGRGAKEKTQENVLKMAQLAADDKNIHAITITDNPGGRPSTIASSLAIEVKQMGIEPIIHFTCKDKNRNGILSELYGLERAGLHNLLVMTGDYPTEGYDGRPKPVFDVDSVQALRLVAKMNAGEEVPSRKGYATLKGTNFLTGAVVSPFKKTEAELMTQYFKLEKKIKSGARFIISQLGYDVRKYDELRRYMDLQGYNVPLIGNIFVLPVGIAKVMNQNRVPGCVVTDEFLRILQLEKDGSTEPRKDTLIRSAKLYAIMKGLRYHGVNISGHGLKYEDVLFIRENGEELSENWQELIEEFQYPINDGFYYFQKNTATMLNTGKAVNRKNMGHLGVHLIYRIFNVIHSLLFDKKGLLYKPMKALCKAVEKSRFEGVFTRFEYGIKSLTNDCEKCGDCAMMSIGYICPMSQCPKQQRNGPCGGSFEGWCEVYPGKQKCIYVVAYERLRSNNREYDLVREYIPPCNWELYKTSSWINYYGGKDYSARSLDMEQKRKSGVKHGT